MPKSPKPPKQRKQIEPKATDEKGWAKADTVTPLLTERLPDEISDGSGIGFSPGALTAPFEPLDPDDPAVKTLIDQIDFSQTGPQVKLPWRGETRTAEELATNLKGWRLLAGTDTRKIFGKDAPPRLVTVTVKRERGKKWQVGAVSPGRQLRASRNNVRACSFRLDPDVPVTPEDTVLRLLVIEQTRSGGRLAYGRFQAPDLYMDDEELLLRCYITPLEGWQAGTRPWETPLLVPLPEPVGNRKITDGAIYFQGAPRSAK